MRSASQRMPVVSMPSVRPRSTADSMLSGRRPAITSVPVPSSARAATTDAAVPPPPRISADLGGRAPAARSPPMIPSTSVFSAYQPPSRRTSVLATPRVRTRSLASSATAAAAAFPGMVTENPTHSGPREATRPGSASPSHSIASYVHWVSPLAAYPARCSAGDNEWDTGAPSTAARRRPCAGSAEDTVGPGPVHTDVVLLDGVAEAGLPALIDLDEVQPRSRNRVQRGRDRVGTW